jgi:hypothetical protein
MVVLVICCKEKGVGKDKESRLMMMFHINKVYYYLLGQQCSLEQ